MTQKTPIPKDQRPAAIERLLRDFRNKNPAAWMPWKEVLQAVGGSERDLTKMMRTTKEKILAEEAAIAAIPELPPEIGSEFERFALSIWKQACDAADVNASELRNARRIDRENMDRERGEYDEIIDSLVQERDGLRAMLETLQATDLEKSEKLEDKQAELRDANAALEELRSLFSTITGSAPDAATPSEQKPSPRKAASSRKTSAKSPATNVQSEERYNASPNEPEEPELPMS